jgi:hypothetical protein
MSEIHVSRQARDTYQFDERLVLRRRTRRGSELCRRAPVCLNQIPDEELDRLARGASPACG